MSFQTAEQRDERTVNGVDVNRLFDTIDAVKAEPEIAKFRFRNNLGSNLHFSQFSITRGFTTKNQELPG